MTVVIDFLSVPTLINLKGLEHISKPGILLTMVLSGQSSHFTDEVNEAQKVKCLPEDTEPLDVKARILTWDNLFLKPMFTSLVHSELLSSVKQRHDKDALCLIYCLKIISKHPCTMFICALQHCQGVDGK